MHVFCKRSCSLIVLFCCAGLQPVLAAESDALPDAPSATIRRQWYATQRPDTSGDSSQSSGSTRVGADSNNGKFVARWLKRGLHDQSDIYTSPFHRSELKWAIGLPALSLGLIAIDKHVSGALPSGHTNVSSDISNAGLFT